jgi:hypothetical protein
MTTEAEGVLPTPGASHRRLDVFVGHWHAEGTSYADGQRADDPRASGVPWISDESYEWLPGGFFVLHRWNARAGEHIFQGTEIIGYDPDAGGYFTRFFDNAGNHPEYQVSVNGDVWTFNEPQTRATVTVGGDGNSMTFKWESRQGDGGWLPLCDRMPDASIRAIFICT